MTGKQWNHLTGMVDGRESGGPLAGFIIDSPWLPGWNGISTMDYFTSGKHWIEANLKAVESFPDVLFFPGFWSEYGMCTEPSAFGAGLEWKENDLPFAHRVIQENQQIDALKLPDVRKNGLLPFIIKRLQHHEMAISRAGHGIKFAVSRGPLNIASFLMGTTELMTGMIMEPDRIHRLLALITDFIVDWLKYQKSCFSGIEGIMILDDLVGFIDEQQIRDYFLPYFDRVYSSFSSRVNFFHNDAHGLTCAPYLHEAGIHIYNFGFQHTLGEMREKAGRDMILMGNIPPRDVLAQGDPGVVRTAVLESANTIDEKERVIWSCGGGMPPGVNSENIHAFIQAINEIYGS